MKVLASVGSYVTEAPEIISSARLRHRLTLSDEPIKGGSVDKVADLIGRIVGKLELLGVSRHLEDISLDLRLDKDATLEYKARSAQEKPG